MNGCNWGTRRKIWRRQSERRDEENCRLLSPPPSARVYFQFSSANSCPTAAGPKEKVGQSEHRSVGASESIRQAGRVIWPTRKCAMQRSGWIYLQQAVICIHPPSLPLCNSFFFFQILHSFWIGQTPPPLPPPLQGCGAWHLRRGYSTFTHTPSPRVWNSPNCFASAKP